MENPEVHTPHAPHGRLPRWLELTIAVTALITSISSIAIAVHHGHIMEKLVQANSIPYMQGGFSNATPQGERVLSLDLLNRGVGPAHEQSLRVKVGDRYVRSVRELIAASLGAEQAAEVESALNPIKNQVPKRFIPGGGQQQVFSMVRTDENAHYWDLLSATRESWDVEFCYCSVFEDCWQILSVAADPQPVDSCRRDETREFVP
ncbi:MAG TPA: hypothetical protein VF161_00255 [Steroidobacteraceae bacterium]